MKRILLIVAVCLGYSLFAQEKSRKAHEQAQAVFETLDYNLLQSPYFLNKGFLFSDDLDPFIQNRTEKQASYHQNPSDWLRLFEEVQRAKNIGKKEIVDPEIYISKYKEGDAIPVGIVQIQGDYLELNAVKKLVENPQTIKSVFEDSENPLMNVVAASVLKDKVLNAKVTFEIVTDLQLIENSEDVWEVDVSDGKGFRPLTEKFTAQYTSTGEKLIAIKWKGADQEIINYSKIEVLYLEEEKPDLIWGEESSGTDKFISTDGLLTYGYFGCDAVFDKPVIILQGYDPEDKNSIAVHTRPKFISAGIESKLRSHGYDVLYVDHINSTRDITENAAFFEDLLDRVNEEKVGDHPNIVIAVSMGGLVARYALMTKEISNAVNDVIHMNYFIDQSKHAKALKYIYSNGKISSDAYVTMEAGQAIFLQEGFHVTGDSNFSAVAKTVPEGNKKGHNVSHFITFDTAHRGNNLPPGIQTLLDDVNETRSFWGTVTEKAVNKVMELLNRPATRQLLMRYRGPDPDPMHAQLQHVLNNMGFPKNGTRNISIINGARNGLQNSVSPRDRILHLKVGAFELHSWSNDTNRRHRISLLERFLQKDVFFESDFDFNYDNNPGGNVVSIEFDFNLGFLAAGLNSNFAFTPTWSASAYTRQIGSQDVLDITVDEIMQNRWTRLDTIYAPNVNTIHADPTVVTTEWNELLSAELNITNIDFCGPIPTPAIHAEQTQNCLWQANYFNTDNPGDAYKHTWKVRDANGQVIRTSTGDRAYIYPSEVGYYFLEVTRTYNLPSQGQSRTNSKVVFVEDCQRTTVSHQPEKKEEPVIELVEEEGIILFPNPVKDQLQVRFNTDKVSPTTIEITDIYGRSYKNFTVSKAETQQGWKQIDVSKMPRGVYTLVLYLTDGNKIRKKFIVQ
jgi:pimeloyl-ACP methyl ester carboxylesterase